MKSFFLKILLLSWLFSESVLGGSGLIHYRPEYHGALRLAYAKSDTDSISVSPSVTKYPARGLVMSLAIPGAGQWYAGARKKAVIFGAIELVGWLAWRQMVNRGEDQREKLETFADDHWDLYQWWQRTSLLTSQYPDVVCHGTHRLSILLPDGKTATSDSLCSGWIEGVEVIPNYEFYENIGKYDQFVAGWDDLFDSEGNQAWWEKEKSVGDSVEVLVMTVRKDKYLDMRQKHNQILQTAGYAISTIMFNHLVSAIDAFLETRKRSTQPQVETSLRLMFSPLTRYGVGGISIALNW